MASVYLDRNKPISISKTLRSELYVSKFAVLKTNNAVKEPKLSILPFFMEQNSNIALFPKHITVHKFFFFFFFFS